MLKKEYFVNNNEFLASDSAKVTLKIANEIYERYTDSMLTANFTTIKSGTALVTIDYPNFCIVKYKITLPDESSLSSQINLLPKEGEFAAILKAKFFLSSAKNGANEFKIFMDEFFKDYIERHKEDLEQQANRINQQRAIDLNNNRNRGRNGCH